MDICNYFDKQDSIVFVAVSLGNHNHEIAYEIATRTKLPLNNYYDKVHIMSFDDTLLNEKIFREEHNESIFTYSYNCEDMNPIFKAKKSIVIFDSLSNVMEFLNSRCGNSLEFIDTIIKNNFVFILGDIKTSKEDLKKFSDFFVECKFWNDSFISMDYQTYILKLHKSIMSEEQYIKQYSMLKHYTNNKKKKVHQGLWKEDGFENAKRFCNIVYNENVQNMIEDAVKNNTQSEFYYENSPKKIMNRCGGANGVLDLSPKFNSLYEVIKSNNGRHIIYTSFDAYYGSDMLYNIFTELKIPTIYIGSEHNEIDKIKALNAWNNTKKYKVLIVNGMLPNQPKDVNHIHIVDSHFVDVFDKIYENCKYENCSSTNITLHLHMSERPSLDLEKTIDELTFPEFYNYLNMKKNFWELVLENSKKIRLNRHGRLEV